MAMSAFSTAALASNGALPWTIAPMRPKCVDITVNTDLRYLIASSGLANCAAAGSAVIRPATAAAAHISFFIEDLRERWLSKSRGRLGDVARTNAGKCTYVPRHRFRRTGKVPVDSCADRG